MNDLSGYRRVLLPAEGKYIYQSRSGHPVTCAAAFLQQCVIDNVMETKVNALDMGCGNGIISIMLALQRPHWHIRGIDLQPELVELAAFNARQCAVPTQFDVFDLRQPPYPGASFDLIVSNPPWIKMDAGIVSPCRARALARTELSCSMQDVISACQYLLRPGGSAFILYPQFRSRDFAQSLENSLLDTIKIFKDKDSEKYCVFHVVKR